MREDREGRHGGDDAARIDLSRKIVPIEPTPRMVRAAYDALGIAALITSTHGAAGTARSWECAIHQALRAANSAAP